MNLRGGKKELKNLMNLYDSAKIIVNINNSFFSAAIFGTYFKLKGENASFDDDLQQHFGTVYLMKFFDLKKDLVLDSNIKHFERKCHLVNDILFEKKIFLRVYELRKKIDIYSKKVTKK